MRHNRPTVTVIILFITALLTALNFRFPGILDALRRSPETLTSKEWWRLITPIFINRGGWLEITFNFFSFTVIGAVAEYVIGRRW